MACLRTEGENERKLLSIVDADQLRGVLRVMLDESEFLSPLAARALTRPSGSPHVVLNDH